MSDLYFDLSKQAEPVVLKPDCSPKILVVDDEPTNIRVLTHFAGHNDAWHRWLSNVPRSEDPARSTAHTGYIYYGFERPGIGREGV